MPTPLVGWHDNSMHQGKELGAAIKKAIDLKGWKQADLARKFHVEPPSVSGWIRTGRIDKGKLWRLMEMLSDVVGPEHWGLDAKAAPKRKPLPGHAVLHPDDPAVKASLTQTQRAFGQLVDSVLPLLNPAQVEVLTRLVVDFVGRNGSAEESVSEEHKQKTK